MITAEYHAHRVDSFLAEQIPDLSRSFINRLADEGKVLISEKVVKPSQKLNVGDIVDVDIDLEKLRKVPEIELPVIYEDESVVVIDKPAGVLSHSKGSYNPEATVATFIKDRITGIKGNRAGIVHRLDRLTSGVMICAKNPKASSWLQKQFSLRKAKKTYNAVVTGHIEPEKAIIDMPIERNPKMPQTFRAGNNGKAAVTKYTTLWTNQLYSLLQLEPETGRTHQLRVHLKALNHPVLGDDLYGGEYAKRLYLHALSLELTLPNGQRKTFTSNLPIDFNKMVK